MEIKALVFKDKQLKLTERPQPVPGEDEVLIQVKLAGICNTDLEIMDGYLGFEGIPGHEFVGRVIYDPEAEFTGQRVVGSINIPCYECFTCNQGLSNHCLNMRALGIRNKDGAFAEYLTLPRENIYPLPEVVTDKMAVFIEPMAAAVEIPEKVHLRPTDEVIVLGDGKLGLLTAQVFWAMGFDVKVIGKHHEKLQIVKKLGIETFLPGELNRMVDVVVECTGSQSGVETALKIVRPEGKIVMKTTTVEKPSLDLSQVAVNEIKIIGSRCGPFAPTLRLLERHKFPLEEMIDSIFPLERGLAAFTRAKEKGVLKVLLEIS